MPQVIEWHSCHPGDAIQRAAELLAGGQLVAFPTEACYEVAANAADPDAVARLQGKDRRPLAVAATGPADLVDWVPGLSRLGHRLARNSWPGPLTILTNAERRVTESLPVDVHRRLCRTGGVAFRAPGHESIHQALALVGGPLALSEAGPSCDSLGAWGDDLALIIDAGPTAFGKRSTVVRVEGEDWEVIDEGVLSSAQVAQLTPCRILFVCTGNTCRSPLAQALCARLLAARLGCTTAELPRRGFIVQSAGLAAMMGGEAAAEAAAVAREMGADLSAHRAQPLSAELLLGADFLFAMTHSHLQMLRMLQAHGGPTPRLLSPRGEDLPDPIGSPAEVYRDCAQAIVRHLEELLPEFYPCA